MDRWQGKVAVVTGAGAGIGAAVCVALAEAGMKVVGIARRTNMVDNLKVETTSTGLIVSRQCDVSKVQDVAAAFKWVEENYGGVDVLVNNAGTVYEGHITDVGDHTISEEEISTTIDTNLKGLVFCTRHAVASMKRRNFDGHIVNISSVLGHYVPSSTYANVYPSTKHAVTSFGSSLSNELAHFKSKVKTTNISPGLVHTVLASNIIEQLALPALQPRDIAAAVLWAVSTPPHCNVTELTLSAVGQTIL